MLSVLSLCILGGTAVGLLNGMFGVGGAVVIIPLLDEILVRMGMDPSVAHVMAVGSSPPIIALTCFSGVLAHRSFGSMRDDILHRMGPGLLAGAVLGAFLTPHVPTNILKLLFFSILAVVCGQTAFPIKRFEHKTEDLRGIGGIAVFFGLLASMSGVAGSILNLTYLNWRGVPWVQAVGTGAAIGLIISVTSSVGYVASGWGVSGLPEWSLGYVYLPGVLCLIVPSMIMARVGAYIINNSKVPVDIMKRGVGFGLLCMAVSMVVKILFFS